MNPTLIFKLLSDETRLRVIMLLSLKDLCVCEMTGILEQPQPKISKVLSKLRDMDLVDDERKEKFVFYKLKSHDALLSAITDHVVNHLVDYPLIEEDLRRLQIKENYIDSDVLASLLEAND